ncbi:helix-turn-helix domain-containing protein [Sulfoacidibacillus thermotolerans]|uniref:HTH cro/C1-type domain-containing protein n=1 Tax=Sulfoacidibacillus thermotolerans TaxID=1765684 RepID=A0A2U3D751_SULT2|nr:helix-turn-helix transcriptional regulator [Sulfoacidibacillus thermotolerans]PWI57106.1 hypothetical protein BM613_10125 [Sulfoacidibacillus thermotolerans]
MSIGERVRIFRKQRGMSQADLAGDWFNRSYISQIESGSTIPPVETLQLLAKKLQVSLEDLLDQPDAVKSEKEPYHKLQQAKRCKSIKIAIEAWQKAIDHSLSLVAVDAALFITQHEGYTENVHIILFTTYNLLTRSPINENAAWYEFMFQLGNSYFHQKQFNEARQIYESLIQTNSALDIEQRARINLASTFFRLTWYELAIMNYERAIDLIKDELVNTDEIKLKIGMCQHGLGSCHHYLGNLSLAFEYTQKAQEQYNKVDRNRWHDANHNLGIILVAQKRYNYAKQKLLVSLQFYVESKLYAKAANVLDDLVKIAILENNLNLAFDYNSQGISYLEKYDYDPVLMVRLLLQKCQILKLQNNESYRDLYTAVKALARAIQFDLKDNALDTEHLSE